MEYPVWIEVTAIVMFCETRLKFLIWHKGLILKYNVVMLCLTLNIELTVNIYKASTVNITI